MKIDDGNVVILALDTSSAEGSAAAIRADGDRTVTIERAGDGSRSHGTRLPLELMAVLDEAGAAIADVDRLAVVVGPGSFTGLRVGIATIQGLALARGVTVVPVTSFEALAWHARPSTGAIALWVEAHRGEVFATLLAPDARTVLAPPTALAPAATLDAWRDLLAPFARVQFLGDGAVRYEAVIRERLGAQAGLDVLQAAPMLAAAAGWIAREAPDRAVHPHALVPMYVRRPDVELTRDRREAASRG
ncbi:MAG TPA: tRNA (adenosine(37)-N6)-threonylcarbamoyltransferase complex dimerization subunit type 1 TsaB [Vicinamibacterales bacterium]|nr:tRNA (adenosine(37)-N6)-threonylcarbamoyltransferase complex dimerization subunit type 1 TsaB [Vicinamibacterales bacterium]